MRTISLYVEKESFIHGLDPITKVWLTASLVIIPFIGFYREGLLYAALLTLRFFNIIFPLAIRSWDAVAIF